MQENNNSELENFNLVSIGKEDEEEFEIFSSKPIFEGNEASLVPVDNEDVIENRARKILDFIKFIRPDIPTNNGQKRKKGDTWVYPIEIRAIKRDNSLPYIQSENIFEISENALSYIKNILKAVNGKPYCLYYSVYSFDNKMNSTPKKDGSGELVPSKLANVMNAKDIRILLADFDKITYEEFLIEKQKFTDLGICTTDIFTGHGYHIIIRLEKSYADKGLLRNFTKLLLKKGFNVDPKIGGGQQVARLPRTYNTKTSSNKFINKYDSNVIPQVRPLRVVEEVYSAEFIFNQLKTLPDIIKENEQITINEIDVSKSRDNTKVIKSEHKENKINTKKDKKNLTKDLKHGFTLLSSSYPQIKDFNRLIPNARAMLFGTPSGYRNDVLMFILPHLVNYIGLSQNQVVEVLVEWGKRCEPVYGEDGIRYYVDRYFKLYKEQMSGANYGFYSEKLEEIYGSLQKNTYTLNNEIKIFNLVLSSKLKKITDEAFRIYLKLKIHNHLTKQSIFTTSEILKICEYSDNNTNTFKRSMSSLVNESLIVRKKQSKKQGQEYTYQFNTYYENAAKAHGYLLFNTMYLKGIVSELSPSQTKLYLYLEYRIRTCPDKLMLSQSEIADAIGKKQHTISEMTDYLKNNLFIDKITYADEWNILHCDYELKQ